MMSVSDLYVDINYRNPNYFTLNLLDINIVMIKHW